MTDADKPDVDKRDADRSDAGTTDAGTSDAGTSDAGTSDAGTSDAGTSAADKRAAGKRNVEKSDAGRSDAAPRGKDRHAGKKVLAGANAVRSRIASLVWLVAVLCALFLAVGALLIALKMNQDNAIVGFVIDAAKRLDFGDFKKFTGKSAEVKSALTNWGIAAVIYLVIGKVLDRFIRP